MIFNKKFIPAFLKMLSFSSSSSSSSRKSHTKTTNGAKKPDLVDQAITDYKSLKKPVNEAKSLKQIIDEFTKIAKSISDVFNCDVKQPLACVEKPETFFGSYEFPVKMCLVKHKGFVHSETVLPQNSKALQKEEDVNKALKILEDLRKMLVTNKQHRNAMVDNLKDLKNPHNQKKMQHTASSFKMVDSVVNDNEHGDFFEMNTVDESNFVEIEHQSPETQRINYLIQQIQQHHRTITRNLCKQIEVIIRTLRTDILAYKLAAEKTIQKIIKHANLCRKFIEKCRRMACIECCASEWWMETQRFPDDHSDYYLTAVEEGEPTEFNASAEEYSALVSGRSAPPPILIQVQSQQRSSDDNSCLIVFSQFLDKELEDKILTEEAVRAFEADEAPTNYYREYGTIRSLPRAADEDVQQSFDSPWVAWCGDA